MIEWPNLRDVLVEIFTSREYWAWVAAVVPATWAAQPMRFWQRSLIVIVSYSVYSAILNM